MYKMSEGSREAAQLPGVAACGDLAVVLRPCEVRSADIPPTSQQSLKFPPLVSVLLLFLPRFPSSLPRLICNMCSFNTERRKGGRRGPLLEERELDTIVNLPVDGHHSPVSVYLFIFMRGVSHMGEAGKLEPASLNTQVGGEGEQTKREKWNSENVK